MMKSIVCNKCESKIYFSSKPEIELIVNTMHSFSAMFEYCGEISEVDDKTCSFTLCQKCLLELISTFKIPVEFKDMADWSGLDER